MIEYLTPSLPNKRMQRRPRSEFRMVPSVSLAAPLMRSVRCLNGVSQMSLRNKYKKSLEEQWCLRFRTHHPDNNAYDGIVTHIKRGFVVLRQEEAFEFDGVIILPRKSIKGYRDNEYDACCNDILRERGTLKKARSPRWLDSCDTLPEVVSQLKRRDIWPGVETLYNENQKSAFYVG